MASPPKTRARTRRASSSRPNIDPLEQQKNQPDIVTLLPNSSPEDDASKKKNADVLPLEIGKLLLCRGKDGKYHQAKIMELRKLVDGGPHKYEYYVHYTKFDSRLDEWVKREQFDLEEEATNVIMTRQRHKLKEKKNLQGHEELEAELLKEDEFPGKVKNFESIEMGRYEMDTWYWSPCDPKYDDCKKLYFCEFCLTYFKKKERLQRHLRKCDSKHPPGNEIYRNDELSVFEVDGEKNWVYCENLCFLAKLFLKNKVPSKGINISTFLFYILCESDDRGYHMVAYFSKEKAPVRNYNVSCILTLPPYQKHGYGKFLISFSYELSKKEGKVGTPEEPLSDLGKVSYEKYWTRVILGILIKRKSAISVKELSDMTAIDMDDIKGTLNHLGLAQYNKGELEICLDTEVLNGHLKDTGSAGIEIDLTKLIWTPYKEKQ